MYSIDEGVSSYIPNNEAEEIHKKRLKLKSPPPQAINVSRLIGEGIQAVKCHYAKRKERECHIKVTEDLKFLFWEYGSS